MARIRTIKPEFFTSEDIVGLTPFGRLLYIALWCEADREGRLVWKPKTFKMRYFPADACDIDAMCAEVIDAGLVVLYGDGYAYIPSFLAHQHINPRETVSQLPDPDAKVTRGARVGTRHSRASDAQGGREGKGKEGSSDASADADLPPASPATPPVISIPLNDNSEHPVSEADVAEWRATFPAVDVLQQLRQMRAWCLATPAKRKTRRGVTAFIVSWLSRAQDRGPGLALVNSAAKQSDERFAGCI